MQGIDRAIVRWQSGSERKGGKDGGGGGGSAPGCRRVEWGKCTLQADPICNWLESASLEGMLEESSERKRERESDREKEKRGWGGRVTGGEGECTHKVDI